MVDVHLWLQQYIVTMSIIDITMNAAHSEVFVVLHIGPLGKGRPLRV